MISNIQIINDIKELKYRFSYELICSKCKYKDDVWWYWFKRYNNERFELLIKNGKL